MRLILALALALSAWPAPACAATSPLGAQFSRPASPIGMAPVGIADPSLSTQASLAMPAALPLGVESLPQGLDPQTAALAQAPAVQVLPTPTLDAAPLSPALFFERAGPALGPLGAPDPVQPARRSTRAQESAREGPPSAQTALSQTAEAGRRGDPVRAAAMFSGGRLAAAAAEPDLPPVAGSREPGADAGAASKLAGPGTPEPRSAQPQRPAPAIPAPKGGRWSASWPVRAWTPFIANPLYYFAMAIAPFIWNLNFRFAYIDPPLERWAERSALGSFVHAIVCWHLLDIVFVPAFFGFMIGPALWAARRTMVLAGLLRPSVAGGGGLAGEKLLSSRAAAVAMTVFWSAVFFSFIHVGQFALIALAAAWLLFPLAWGALKLLGATRAGPADLEALHLKALPLLGFLFALMASVFLELFVMPFQQGYIGKDLWDIPSYFAGFVLLWVWWRGARARLSAIDLKARALSLLRRLRRPGLDAGREVAAEIRALDGLILPGLKPGTAGSWRSFLEDYSSFLTRLALGYRESGLSPRHYVKNLPSVAPEAQAALAQALAGLARHREALNSVPAR